MPARIPPPFRDEDNYFDYDAVVLDPEPEEIPIDDLLEQPFEEPITLVVDVCPTCGRPFVTDKKEPT